MSEKRPNIVIFNPDQWRADVLGFAGNPAAVTPNLDRVTQEDGVGFTRAFCQATVCTPSRCSFMSGWYAHVRGHRTMYHMQHQYGYSSDDPVLLATLKNEGYYVWWGGKNDLTPGQESVERHCHYRNRVERRVEWFDPAKGNQWRGEPDSDTFYSFYRGKQDLPEEDRPYDGDWGNVLAAVELIRTWPKDRPFCAYLPLGFPHPAYRVEDPWYSMIDREKIPDRFPTPDGWRGKPSILRGIWENQNMQTWTEERWTELRATYYGMCARVDHQYGMIMDALREAGLYDDTAVFMFSDHGDYTGDYGIVEKCQNSYEDCITNVPLVIKPPAWVETKPGVSDALVELIDFPATVEAMTGIEPGHDHFGRSLLPVLSGEADAHRDAVYTEGGRLEGEEQCKELESTSSQNPSGEYWPRLDRQRHIPEHTKAVMCRTQRHKYTRRHYETDELYDLVSDPGELVNRIDDPALSDVLAELRERMLTWFVETCDVVPRRVDRR